MTNPRLAAEELLVVMPIPRTSTVQWPIASDEPLASQVDQVSLVVSLLCMATGSIGSSVGRMMRYSYLRRPLQRCLLTPRPEEFKVGRLWS
jgi:hypothetical protein